MGIFWGKKIILIFLGCYFVWFHTLFGEVKKADVVIYGGTSAALTSAVQVKRMGKTVLVVSPDLHLGGLSSSGLGWTDSGKKQAIGGIAREFYHRVWRHYHGKTTVTVGRVHPRLMEIVEPCGFSSRRWPK
jgi:hypothetical protein